MYRELFDKIKESATSILPISFFVLLLNFTVAPLDSGFIMLLLSGSVLLIIGLGLFTLGSDMGLMPIGEIMGSKLTSSRKIWLLVGGSFLLGFFITIAEPDLQVLTEQVPSIPATTLMLTIAIGVGFFLLIGVLRILFKVKLSYILIGSYVIIFSLAFLGNTDFTPIAFDSGGITTGPITVPFILAFGAGISVVNATSKSSEEDSFGLCSICMMGPILSVLILGNLFPSEGIQVTSATTETINSFSGLLNIYGKAIPIYLKHVVLSLIPIAVIFYGFQIIALKLPKKQILKITIGMVYTFVGLSIFLIGANIGFLPVGAELGKVLISQKHMWIIVPVSGIIGVLIVAAEPTVYALNKQIEEITSGAMSKRTMFIGLAGGVGIALMLSVIRIIFQFNVLYYLVPGYAIALILTFFVSPLFTGIAFDSGTVASGAMAAAFILPFAIGASEAVGGNPILDAFGVIAMITMMPPICVQIIGFLYEMKLKRSLEHEDEETLDTDKNIYDFDRLYDYSNIIYESDFTSFHSSNNNEDD